MEKNFTIKFSTGESKYEAVIEFTETDTESWYRVEYKNENVPGNIQIVEIVFDPNLKNDQPAGWSVREGSTCSHEYLAKEFLDAAGKEIEDHVELFE
jgi:hypothetical protein